MTAAHPLPDRRSSRPQGHPFAHQLIESRVQPGLLEAKPRSTAELLEKISGMAVDAPLCFTCGTKMRRSGSCYICEGCGSTSGCS